MQMSNRLLTGNTIYFVVIHNFARRRQQKRQNTGAKDESGCMNLKRYTEKRNDARIVSL